VKRAISQVRLFIGALLLAVGCTAHAYWIGLVPVTSTQPLNGIFSVDVVVSGLETDGLILSTYDLNVGFDASFLQFLGATSAGGLGGGSFFSATSGAGFVNLFELSFLDDAALAGAQGDLFTLASISFQGIAPGTTTLAFSNLLALGGAQVLDPGSGLLQTQDLLALPHTTGSASVTITANAVPEPGTLLLAALALLLVPLVRRPLRRR
jgi:hypothetical protein